MEAIQLLHGTCGCKAEIIRKEGLKANSCLTDDHDIAHYYGEAAVDECDCGFFAVLTVVAPSNTLKPDYPSYEEPLSQTRNKFTSCDREWYEMVENGEIPSPSDENDYATSLEVVNAVRCTIPLTVIED